jgi:hypothetical protein
MSKILFVKSDSGSNYEYSDGRLIRANDPDGCIRTYSYIPKAHLEYVKLKSGEEWFSIDGRSARGL